MGIPSRRLRLAMTPLSFGRLSNDATLSGCRSRRARVSFVVLLIFLFPIAHTALAQITAAAVSGVVTDESDAALPGVHVIVRNIQTGQTRSAVTGDDGSYHIAGLPPGVYEARGILAGFITAIDTDVPLSVAQHFSLNMTMRVGATEALLVVATPAIVDISTSALSALVDEKTITELPLNGRNFMELALLQPGVAAFATRQRATITGRGQQINVNGADGRANSYLLDGANMNGYAGLAVATAADTTLGVDMIREFRVVTNAFSADYGRATGGVVSVVTKSGTNDIHGSGLEFFRSEALDARNFFDREKPPFERHQFGFTSGGPIRRNRTFFFGGVERLVENLGVTQVTEVPSAAARAGELVPIAPIVEPYLALFPPANGADLGGGLAELSFPFDRTTRETLVQARVDHNLSTASRLFVRYTFDDAGRRLPTQLPLFSSDQQSRNQWLTVEQMRTAGSSLLNTLRFSYSRVRLSARLADESILSDLAFLPGQGAIGNILIGSREFGPDRTLPQRQNIQYFTFSNDVTYSRGRHFLKAGVLVERAYSETESGTGVRGRFTFPNVLRFLAGAPSRFTGVLPGYQVARSRRNTTVGIYVQDDLMAHARLTVNLGLRYEFYTVPNDTHGRDSALRDIVNDSAFTVGPIFVNPSLKNIGPRVGFAWNVSGDGRIAVRGGAGIYYDTDGPFNSAMLAAAFSPPFAESVNLANPTFPQPSFERVTVERSARALDYHIRQPRMLSGHVDVQREMLPTIVLSVAYATSRGYNLVQAIEGNPVVPQILADGTIFFPADAPRRNPHWESIDYRTTDGRSWYHAMQLGATKRFSNGQRWQMSYTLGKAIDETQGQTAGDATNSSVFPQNPIDPRRDRGPADFDVRHTFAMNATWLLPFGASRTGLTGALMRGWQINGIGILRSGVPFSPAIQTQSNWSRSGNVAPGAEDRPNLRPGVNGDDIILGGPTQYFDPKAFGLQPRGFLGSAGRNILTGPGLANVDLSLVKNSRWAMFGVSGAIEFRIEAFNVFNRTNFAIPNRVVFSPSEGDAPLPTAGRITSTMTDARQVQLGVKVRF
jgi:Carboxypeptidase regulatory-like domain/TonB dependent receptor-like, beta-barrel/TonB-dependent Receptor Plug Domain